MTTRDADQKFENALKIFETQVAETTQFWFAAAAINEIAVGGDDTLTALNLTPSFWITALVAMEYQAILAAAKIFGPRKTNPHNIDFLFQVLRETRADAFSKRALEARKRKGSSNADEWISDYMKKGHVPTVREVNRTSSATLRANSGPCRARHPTRRRATGATCGGSARPWRLHTGKSTWCFRSLSGRCLCASTRLRTRTMSRGSQAARFPSNAESVSAKPYSPSVRDEGRRPAGTTDREWDIMANQHAIQVFIN